MKKVLLQLLLLATLAFAAVSIDRNERGIVVTMDGDIFFEFNKANLAEAYKPNLIELANILIEHEELEATIEGHSDTIGTRAVNLRISTARAFNVMSFLIEHGVPREHLNAIGVAFDKPIASNATAEGRRKNRRVELIIKEHPNSDALMEKLTQMSSESIKIDNEQLTMDNEKTASQPPLSEPPPPDTTDNSQLSTLNSQLGEKFFAPTYFFTFRPEFLLVSGEISTVGTSFEGGLIFNNGLVAFASMDIGGHYTGAWLNLGYEVEIENTKNILGISGGYHYTELKYNIEDEKGNLLRREWGKNETFGGVFWKLRPYKTSNIDIMNKVAFGRKSDAVRLNKESDETYTKDGLGVVWSIGIGYTFTGRMK